MENCKKRQKELNLSLKIFFRKWKKKVPLRLDGIAIKFHKEIFEEIEYKQ